MERKRVEKRGGEETEGNVMADARGSQTPKKK